MPAVRHLRLKARSRLSTHLDSAPTSASSFLSILYSVSYYKSRPRLYLLIYTRSSRLSEARPKACSPSSTSRLARFGPPRKSGQLSTPPPLLPPPTTTDNAKASNAARRRRRRRPAPPPPRLCACTQRRRERACQQGRDAARHPRLGIGGGDAAVTGAVG